MTENIAQDRFRKLTLGGATAGLIAHGIFVVVLGFLGATILVWFNVASVVLYAFCLQLVRRDAQRIAATLIQSEVLAHAALAVWLLGWDSGFHYYVFCLIPLAIVLPRGSTARGVAFLALCATLYVGLSLSVRAIEPFYIVDAEALGALRAFNIAGTFAVLSYLVLILRRAIIHAEGRLTDIANTDLLSGLYTRRHGLYLVEREMARARRNGTPLALALADIDGFKQVNDRHGHELGDHLVAAIGQRMRAGVRKNDMVARWGGDEFLLILSGLDGASARAAVGRVQQSVANDPIRVSDLDIHVGMSFGITEYSPGDTVEGCVRAADAALYDGKRMGRGKVVLATPVAPKMGAIEPSL